MTKDQDDATQEQHASSLLEEAGIPSAGRPALADTAPAILRPLLKPAAWVTLLGLLLGLYVEGFIEPQWREQKTQYQVYQTSGGHLAYRFQEQEILLGEVVPYEQSPLRQAALDETRGKPELERHWVYESLADDGSDVRFAQLQLGFHFGPWSFLPALITVVLCLLTREPLTALLMGIITGALMLGKFDLTGQVLIPGMASVNTASIVLLYLWLLGGILGIWSKTGAAKAFAEFMAKHFIRGPRSAKVVSWLLGALFFQGGSISTVLVGTTVKPLADRQKVSHEELSYIVDSTASPIASLLAFNAWPAYVQAFIYLPGVAFLATEADRIRFFFASVPFSFYSIFAVLGTLLLSLNISRFSGSGMRKAMFRARETGELDAPDAKPLAAKELGRDRVPDGYTPNVLEFIIPVTMIIGIAVGTFVYAGTPQVQWAFGMALITSVLIALFKGMSLGDVIEGFGDGLKGVVVASVILVLAVTIGTISKEIGGGIYLVELMGNRLPFWLLPVCLQLITMLTAFSTGTSWGTYAIAFPLAMPLAWAVAQSQGLANPELYMMVCFATVLNGSVYGDQCSPISDTTILSAMSTGCDLMDHVKTQIVPASIAAALAAILWTLTVYWFA